MKGMDAWRGEVLLFTLFVLRMATLLVTGEKYPPVRPALTSQKGDAVHIPDGMLSTPVALVADFGAAGLIAHATTWVKRHLSEQKIVLMAVLGALIFALQMLNFPVAGGTSGHFLGAALAAILVGFWPTVIIMAAVLGIQCLVFSDGGVLAYGANLLNMGIIAGLVGWASIA